MAHLEPGATVALDADVSAFPGPFSQLAPGLYAVQAVLDRDHGYNYTGYGPGDLVSGVMEVELPANGSDTLTLATVVPESDPLQQQVNYPKLCGGAWPTSPDPSDFHDFVGIDLYGPRANVYHKADGTPWPLAQANGRMLVSIEDYARREVVVGPYGGQMASFEWAFSPRGADGRPLPMFDRTTGAVDPAVVAYWKEHYDLYAIGDDPWGLYRKLAWEMYAVARPGAKRPQ